MVVKMFGLLSLGKSIFRNAPYWQDKQQAALLKTLFKKPNFNKAKNVIFFLGDGMSLTTVSTSRIYKGQLKGSPGEEGSLFFDDFPNTGLVKTYCVDSQVADSACSATAYWTGVKGNIKTIGVTGAVKREGSCSAIDDANSPASLLDWAQNSGKATGIVTTTTVTHASPAGGYAHVINRNMESDAEVVRLHKNPKECVDIAQQLMLNAPGKNLNVIMGGGRANFYPIDADNESGTKGKRRDGKNLIDSWIESKKSTGKSKFVWNREQLLSADLNNTDYLLGLFANEHLMFYQLANKTVQPSLEEMTASAIEVLQRNPNGFFLFVEGGLIDQAHHKTMARLALDETVEFDKAVEKAYKMTNPEETLIIVTADHAHTLSFSGYPSRGSDILGVAGRSSIDKMPYLTLGYSNGPNYWRHNISVDSNDIHSANYTYPAGVPMASETHGGEDVPIYASGPWSHLFSKTIDQIQIPGALAFAACIGSGPTACDPELQEVQKSISVGTLSKLDEIMR
ncbi:unnamed protein product [Nesidiocoris tenuis]|uniref:Alkaline phosphatase n=1 Tax=Nesidiocoris tenuis TaxID=355587 RepID=A0A6H5HJT7_9HEMI|nr:unnamed protein product [Nesidiocoris tenuis]